MCLHSPHIVGPQLQSHLPPRFSCFPGPSLEILEEQQQTHMCYRTTLDLAVHLAPSSPEACSSHSLPRFSNHTIIYPVIQAEKPWNYPTFPFSSAPSSDPLAKTYCNRPFLFSQPNWSSCICCTAESCIWNPSIPTARWWQVEAGESPGACRPLV